MSNVEAIILGLFIMAVYGYGVGKVFFSHGYVHGYEDATHKNTITFVDE